VTSSELTEQAQQLAKCQLSLVKEVTKVAKEAMKLSGDQIIIQTERKDCATWNLFTEEKSNQT
jgi:hypothetical protein